MSDTEMVRISLLGVHLGDLVESREHHDTVFRELAVIDLGAREAAEVHNIPDRVQEMARELRSRYASFGAGAVKQVETAMARGEKSVDLELVVPSRVGADAAAFRDLLQELDEVCSQRLLVTVCPSERARRFRRWYLTQLVDQAAGAPPVPYQRWEASDPSNEEIVA